MPRHQIYGRSERFRATSGESLNHTDAGSTEGQTEPELRFYSLTGVYMAVTRFRHSSVHSDPLIHSPGGGL